MSKGLIDLISVLDLEPLRVNLFRGNSPKTSRCAVSWDIRLMGRVQISSVDNVSYRDSLDVRVRPSRFD